MIGRLLRPEIQEMLTARNFRELRETIADWTPPEVASLIDELSDEDVALLFRLLPHDLATETFEYLSIETQQRIIDDLAHEKARLGGLLNNLSPDDRTALFEELPGTVVTRLLDMLSPEERRTAVMLLGYPEHSIGRLMTTDYIAIRPPWTVAQALEHIRRYGRDSETLNVIYVVDEGRRLLADLRIRELLLADPERLVSDLMGGPPVSLKATEDQEVAVRLFSDYDRIALPVTDSRGVLIGIVTVDDVLDVAQEEATEDMQKVGGVVAFEEPYLSAPVFTLVQKRTRWLVVLFVGEMLTASAMGYFEDEIARALILTIFLPLIISSGGNSGSQAATLIVRGMAVGEIALRDWWRVLRRELLSGVMLGSILGAIGLLRVGLAEWASHSYGDHWFLIGVTVGLSLIGVVLVGTTCGSMLPFIMRRIGADPATSSTPFVATLVDVTGLAIYFTIAAAVLKGTLL